jgi:anthranilate synthase component I
MNISTAERLPVKERTVLTPVVRELPADLETPVSVYLKLAPSGPSFLLESVNGGEQVARYSFIGLNPRRAYVFRNGSLEMVEGNKRLIVPQIDGMDPLSVLREEVSGFRIDPVEGLPRFAGGLVGYLGYESIRFFEPRVPTYKPDIFPDAIFLLAETLVAFDHAYGRLLLITFSSADPGSGFNLTDPEQRLDDIETRLFNPDNNIHPTSTPIQGGEFRPNVSRDRFLRAVSQAKEEIAAGEIFQVVLSQQLTRHTQARPFDIYRALRRLNPSPYMFFLDFADLAGGEPLRIIGASPEMHVRLEGDQASIRPIAGTRPRGRNEAEDQLLEADLLADEKELAEHLMLLDLARNDLGRVCEYGSILVREQMTVERYSHVMHIVSQVDGHLREKEDAFSLLRATFPAGTVSGAPKVRAMQIIHDLEGTARGPYAGAVGYFSFDGSMDTCITIRTLLLRGNQIVVQAGAGIVADSEPELEFEETLNKARALGAAIDLAEDGLHSTRRREEIP